MALSVVRVTNLTISQASILFNDDINTDVGIGNVTITPYISNVPTPEIKSLSVSNETVTITFSPLFPNVLYKIEFK